MAELSLYRCKIIDSDDPNLDFKLKDFINNYDPILIFKSQHSEALKREKQSCGGYIFLDGTWDKAKSILFANKLLKELPQCHLESTKKSIYSPLRKACSEEFLSTLEAIKEVIEVDEQRNLEDLLSPLKFVIEEQKKWVPKDPS